MKRDKGLKRAHAEVHHQGYQTVGSMTWNSERWIAVVVRCIHCAVLSVVIVRVVQDFCTVARGAGPRLHGAGLEVVLVLEASGAGISVLAILWIMRPKLTAYQFLRLLREGRFEEIRLRCLRHGDAEQAFNNRYSRWELWQLDESSLREDPRSPLDVLFGRLRFKIASIPYDFTANRGVVYCG